MEDRFQADSYECDSESDNEYIRGSSDEEKDFDVDYFLTTEAGKDILKSKDKNEAVSNDGGNLSVKLGPTIPKEQLMYDPDIDKNNQQWIDNKRKKYAGGGESSKPRKSDAILSCPACMVTVCVDCQRHDLYKTQFRAMFVMNCHIVADELLRYEIKNKSKKRRRKEGPGKLVPYQKDDLEGPANTTENISKETIANDDIVVKKGTAKKTPEIYNPVKCDCCETELAVYDKDEVYHFHNVLESLS